MAQNAVGKGTAVGMRPELERMSRGSSTCLLIPAGTQRLQDLQLSTETAWRSNGVS